MHISNMAAGLAARGWHLIEIHGVKEDGSCTCQKGRDCPNPGKHPVARNWQAAATADEESVVGWFDAGLPRNIGLLLGPKSGLVDVEFDCEEGEQFAADLRLDELQTPTYRSARSVHRLFEWSADLPPVAVRKVRGLEVRIGGGGASAQSVLPPSRHHTGAKYEWLPGKSPDEVEVQRVPERLAAMLWNEVGAVAGDDHPRRPPARRVLDSQLPEGTRNNELYRFAVREAFRIPNLDDPQEQADLLLKLTMVNNSACKPPLDGEEVRAIYMAAIAYRRKADAAGVNTEVAVERAERADNPQEAAAELPNVASRDSFNRFTRWGLSFHPPRNDQNGEAEWWPGEWRLTIVHSDPREYRITVPAWRLLTQDGTGSVSLTTAQFESPAKVASAVLERTGKVLLNENPEEWRQIWMGRPARAAAPGRRARRAVRGLMSKLMDASQEEWPGASSLRYVNLAAYLLDRLLQAQPPQDEDTPCPSGRPTWRQDGTLWFGWNRTWEDIERQHRLFEGERLSIKRRLCALFGGGTDFQHAKFRHPSGKQMSYVIWTRRELALLEQLATEGSTRPAEPEVNTPSVT